MKILVQTQTILIENIYLDIDTDDFNQAVGVAEQIVKDGEFDNKNSIVVDESPREIQTSMKISEPEFYSFMELSNERK